MRFVADHILNSTYYYSQEIIQNADDAGAETVKFYLDGRQHGRTSLVHPDLAPYQGPALLAYNDAQFTDEDWEGIQNLQRSVKAEDPFKVGKFGIGFNSVYHITGSTLNDAIFERDILVGSCFCSIRLHSLVVV